mgnify:FL=1
MRVPDGVRRLVAAAMDAPVATGFMVTHGRDSGGAPFVVFRAVQGDDREVRMVWHTRDAGTYRLFSGLARTPGRSWRPVTLRDAIGILAGEGQADV